MNQTYLKELVEFVEPKYREIFGIKDRKGRVLAYTSRTGVRDYQEPVFGTYYTVSSHSCWRNIYDRHCHTLLGDLPYEKGKQPRFDSATTRFLLGYAICEIQDLASNRDCEMHLSPTPGDVVYDMVRDHYFGMSAIREKNKVLINILQRAKKIAKPIHKSMYEDYLKNPLFRMKYFPNVSEEEAERSFHRTKKAFAEHFQTELTTLATQFTILFGEVDNYLREAVGGQHD